MKAWHTAVAMVSMTVGLAACAHSGDSQVIQLRGLAVPTTQGSICTASASGGQTIDHGVLDLAVSSSYRVFPMVTSLLSSAPGAAMNPATTDTNTILLNGMTVSVSSGMLSSTPFGNKSGAGVTSAVPMSSWTVPATGTLVAGGQISSPMDLIPSKALVGSKVVPIGEDWRSRFFAAAGKKDFTKVDLVLTYQITGTTLSGDNVITDIGTLPLTVCYGCLIAPAKATTNAADYYQGCADATGFATADLPCLPGQDAPVDCRYYCHICQQATPLNLPTYDRCSAVLCPP